MNDRTKHTLTSIGVWILILTFAIPVIPILGFTLFNSSPSEDTSKVKASQLVDTATTDPELTPYTDEELKAKLNEARSTSGVPILSDASYLTHSVNSKLLDMKSYSYTGLRNPTTGKQGHQFISDQTSECSYMYEATGGIAGDASSTLENFLKNSSLKSELLDSRYDYVSIGSSENQVIIHMCDKRIHTPTPRYSSSYYYDLDCEDIGYEHYVGHDDPNRLDGDGDGWACEGW